MKRRMGNEAVSPVIAVVLMVAITVVLAATVFILVSDIGKTSAKQPPQVGFAADSQTKNVTVVQVSQNGLVWSDFTITGCTAPTGTVDPGDRLTSCSGEVMVSYKPTGTLIWTYKF